MRELLVGSLDAEEPVMVRIGATSTACSSGSLCRGTSTRTSIPRKGSRRSRSRPSRAEAPVPRCGHEHPRGGKPARPGAGFGVPPATSTLPLPGDRASKGKLRYARRLRTWMERLVARATSGVVCPCHPLRILAEERMGTVWGQSERFQRAQGVGSFCTIPCRKTAIHLLLPGP